MGVEARDPLAGLSPQTTAMVAWDDPKAIFRLATYLTDREPPLESVTSAHAVVIHTNLIVVMRRIDDSHYLPGGPIKEGESHEEALARELYDECALSILTSEYLGFVHFSPHGAGRAAVPAMFHVIYGIAATGSPFLGDADRFREIPRMARPAQAAALVGIPYAQPFIERAIRDIDTSQEITPGDRMEG